MPDLFEDSSFGAKLMTKPFSFEPELVKQPAPFEQAQLGSQRASEVYRQLQIAAKGFDFRRFMEDFADPLINAYNVEAKKLGYPTASREWFKILQTADGGAMAPKDFFVKHRALLQPRLFPGDPAKANEAFDLLLTRLGDLPKITSGPISGELAHEFGHVGTYQNDPNVPAGGYGRLGAGKESRPVVGTAISEAVASYRGFKDAWKAWERFGMPHKAWGAWFGFPTYMGNMTKEQLDEVFNRLKSMEGSYPGIVDQAYKALYEYHKFVEPVMYNVPGSDWTNEEKEALKRFLEDRGGHYIETLPEESVDRLKHLRKQPFVMKQDSGNAGKRLASLPLPLSKRVTIPISSRSK